MNYPTQNRKDQEGQFTQIAPEPVLLSLHTDADQTPPAQPGCRPTNTPTTRQLKKALNALNKLGAIHHNRHHITITNHTLLTTIANA
jgi:hypothetical protein